MTKESIVSGIIIPCDWDDDGNVLSYNIETYSEEEYILRGKWSLKQLSKLAKKPVRITGTIRTNKRGQKILSVRNIKLEEKFAMAGDDIL